MKKVISEAVIKSWPSLVVLLAIVIIIRLTIYFKGEHRKLSLHEELFNLLFVAYLLLLFQLVTEQDISAYNSTNLMPFREILRYDFGTAGFYKQVVGNIILFVPFGYFVSGYCRIKKLGTITLVAFLSSLVIEVVQHFIGRSFDVDDIILNVVGGIIGFLIYVSLNAIREHLPAFLRKDWFLNLLCLIIVVLIALYLIRIF